MTPKPESTELRKEIAKLIGEPKDVVSDDYIYPKLKRIRESIKP